VKPSDWYLLSALWMLVAASFLDGPRALPPLGVGLLTCWISGKLLRREQKEMENEARRQELARKIMERGPTTTPVRRGES
jgi:hypothetical protein